MRIDFSKLQTLKAKIEPRDIFMELPSKSSNYGYPRDVQTEVWKQWFQARNQKNTLIKMNTGSGKTVVGLMILQSCLNEGKGPAVYVVPDNFLVNQVCSEAFKLGIKVAYDKEDIKGEDDYYFLNNQAILVTNIHKLVNGKSVFGMRPTYNKKIGSIIIDDVHACLDVIEKQHTMIINSENGLYQEIIDCISGESELKNNQNFCDIIERKDPRYSYLIPFWVWQKKCKDIYDKITNEKYTDESFVVFNMPLMRDNWKTANCVISTRKVEISLKGTPINKIMSFEQAHRRIFMSATLADDSVLVSTLGVPENDLQNIITPEKANDIGERLILFPKHINPKLTDTEIKQAVYKTSRKYNVVVIVPSFERVKFWQDLEPCQILSSKSDNIQKGIETLKSGKIVGLTILVNKYDGIDLPDNACRMLVIDGLPSIRSEYDLAIQGINPKDYRFCREQIQKIEQGMGRGIRSNNDYCSIVLMGDKLADVIVNQQGKEFFSSATLEQWNLSKQVWEQLLDETQIPSVEEIFDLNKYILGRDANWISASKAALSNVNYDKERKVDSLVLAMRNAFEKECIEDYEKSFSILEQEKNKIKNDDKLKGLLMQFMAEYKNFSNPVEAQELLLAARRLNAMVTKPIKGISVSKLSGPASGQGSSVLGYLREKGFDCNQYILHVLAQLEDLKFHNQSAKLFEKALYEVGLILGIPSERPELKYGGEAPDNLFAFSNSEYVVIECKNKTITDDISKDDCEQLLSSIQWFKNKYLLGDEKCIPVMIHNSNIFSKEASPSSYMRIMTPKLLEEFSEAIRNFSEGVFDCGVIKSAVEIEKLLNLYKLNGKQIIDRYTKPAKTKR
jgi:hypothetical protein